MVEVIFDSELESNICPLCGSEIVGSEPECKGCGVALEHPATPIIAPQGF